MTKNISYEESEKIIESNKDNQNFVIIDCRTPMEFHAGNINNSINLDFYSPNFSSELENLNKDKTYLIYCRTGSRSKIMLEMMEKLNFKEVYNMENGILRG
ncbi:rhodanese-like domain-containing protein [Candidatus Falkowbacteria bacterium]|jgi:rhodanese-related sulfurtransferase|nr:rhodanese-like domain-containing protein [Candidatus Falkowbacteria bacterium]MBT4432802.1 rhodanese-like domain-containing protein [Candidatus Falkowbacteria bacterium]